MKVKKILVVLLSMVMLFSITTVAFAEEAYHFGDEKQNVDVQGANGWYYMYSTSGGKGENFDTTTLKECVKGYDGYDAWGGTEKHWVPDPETVTVDGAGKTIEWYNVWFMIHANGKVEPAITGIAAALKWVAPNDGEYKVAATVKGGMHPDAAAYEKDGYEGATFSVYQGTTKLDSINSGKATIEKTFDQTVRLKKGDALYFITDPNKASWETSFWSIDILPVSTDTAPDTTTDTTPSTTTDTTTDTEQNANPKTSDAGIAVSLVMFAASAASIFALKRRK